MVQSPYNYYAPSLSQGTPANPTAPSSTSAYAMQGIGQLITPATPAANVLALLSATLTDGATTVGEGILLQLYYGPVISGVAIPANAGAIPTSAIAIGNPIEWATGVTLTTAADSFAPITLFGLAKALTPGQQYWFDVAAKSVIGASQVALTNVNFAVIEIG